MRLLGTFLMLVGLVGGGVAHFAGFAFPGFGLFCLGLALMIHKDRQERQNRREQAIRQARARTQTPVDRPAPPPPQIYVPPPPPVVINLPPEVREQPLCPLVAQLAPYTPLPAEDTWKTPRSSEGVRVIMKRLSPAMREAAARLAYEMLADLILTRYGGLLPPETQTQLERAAVGEAANLTGRAPISSSTAAGRWLETALRRCEVWTGVLFDGKVATRAALNERRRGFVRDISQTADEWWPSKGAFYAEWWRRVQCRLAFAEVGTLEFNA